MSGFVVSTWAAVSPYGIGRKPFADGLTDPAPAPSTVDDEWGAVPGAGPHLLVPEFDPRAVLGRKGTRSMDRVSALAVATVRELLDTDERTREVATGERAALVLGTTTGSVKSMMDITRDTLIHEKPFYIDAARIPNAIMNSAAAQCAIWHQLKGPNTTVAGGRVAGLFALRYSMRLLAAERAGAVLCGAAEEFSASRAWLEHHGHDRQQPDVLGEGCALLLLERGQDTGSALAEVLAVETGVHGGASDHAADVTAAVTGCLRRALDRAGVSVADVWAVSSVPGDDALGAGEAAAVTEVFGGRVRRIPDGQPWGDAGAVTAAFQVVSVLAAAEHDPAAAGKVAVVLTVDRDGVLGCALLRLGAAG